MASLTQKIVDILPNLITGGEQYPVEVTLVKERRGENPITTDKGRRITTEEGRQKYEIKNEDVETKEVPYDYIHNVDGTDKVFIFSPQKGEYKPFMLTPGDDGETVEYDDLDTEMHAAAVMSLKEQFQSWQESDSWLKDNIETIAFAAIGLGILLSFAGMAYYQTSVLDQYKEVAQAMIKASETLAESQLPSQ